MSEPQTLQDRLTREQEYLEDLQSELDLIHNTARRQGRKVIDAECDSLYTAIDETNANINAFERVLALMAIIPVKFIQQ